MQFVPTSIITLAERGLSNTCRLLASLESYRDNSEERETYGQGTRGPWADQQVWVTTRELQQEDTESMGCT